MKLIDDWHKSWRLRSVQVSGTGAILGAIAAGLIASGAAVPWLGLIPTWAVFAGGALICALTVLGRLQRQDLPADSRPRWRDRRPPEW